ncbi:hypothetical protein VBD025_14415 [Virgibacillus flavescens]|uniref:hypothetical protein n=1 Tax=Virgibacillus flavescens TaxID=1611422 RepID=UPI003D336999
MNDWWNRKKQKTRKSRKNRGDYRSIDFIFDMLFWIPEFALLPFRLLYWLIRGAGRLIGNISDFT